MIGSVAVVILIFTCFLSQRNFLFDLLITTDKNRMSDEPANHADEAVEDGDDSDRKNQPRQHDSGLADLEKVTDYVEEAEINANASANVNFIVISPLSALIVDLFSGCESLWSSEKFRDKTGEREGTGQSHFKERRCRVAGKLLMLPINFLIS